MIRYKVILTQTSIVDAEDEQEAKDKIVDTFDFGNLDVYAEELHPDDVNPDDDEHMKPMTKKKSIGTQMFQCLRKNTSILMRSTHKIVEILKLKVKKIK